MVITKKFNSVDELQKLQRLATQVTEDVYLHSLDDSIMVDAKSFINLFTLDFTQPVKIVTESERVAKAFQ
jgi:phosphotransferase system HPr-like phosphotransfer protein